MEKAYIVLQESSSDKLMSEVNMAIEAGYLVVGGVSIAIAPGGWQLFVQAMVKSSAKAA